MNIQVVEVGVLRFALALIRRMYQGFKARNIVIARKE